ncbi:DNA repair protein RecN [Pontiella sulfatireligans]|uniref:DNA repair protein RecN n=1 Tax=Pontiella sulfatireligans TaxID=2750658 RepID=A0A6C2UGW4_9BACT|nr:DNA repair protein RecN [Pontiella sulfatireligans]VGO18757.1 DNA repair protein RecN [Pontiella sulfatireligans]
MLRTLKIKNLALVDDVQVGFNEGLNVITGETGAGKSLLIGALRLLLGERADKSMIRTGEALCSVYAEFGLSNAAQVDAVLTDVGMEPCDGGLLIIRRIITESSNKTLVNDEPVTLNVLKRLGEVLVDMHGPYDHQSLLDQAVQLEILDAFGQLDAAKKAYACEYSNYRKIQKCIDALNSDNEEDLERQIEFLDYRVNEIEVAKLTVEEEAEVEEEHSVIANSQQLIELSNGAVNALTEGEGCAFDGLASAQQVLNQLIKLVPEAQEWHDEIESAVTSVQEVVRSIENSAAGIDSSPERMQWLDDRLTTYQTLKRKYGSTVEEVQQNGKTWEQQLSDLRGRDKKRLELQGELDLVFQTLEKAGLKLRQMRENVADNLSECITKELIDIGFEHGFFDVQINACAPGPSGMDEIEFGFAPNAGEDMRPLRMIASSGEISRVMLATKAVLARQDQIPVLVFDEIDANVGGEIGGAVGRKLAQVAECHQLICITHLPQVAACGTTHLAVSKKVEDGRTYTEVELLDPESRPDEIARMLGGKDSTTSTLQHAREMLGM